MADTGESGGEGGNVFNTITKGKIGKVPVWAIGAMLAAAIVVVMYIRNRKKVPVTSGPTGGPTTFDPNAIDPSTGLPYGQFGSPTVGSAYDQYLNSDPTLPSYPVGLGQNGLPAPVTNVQWARLVQDALLAQGDDPTIVSNALSKYLNGQTLSDVEQAVINLALKLYGSPPEGVLPINAPNPGNTGGNTGGSTPPPAGPQYDTVQAGQNVDQWILDRQKFVPDFTWAKVLGLNPQISANIKWHTHHQDNTFINTATYRVA